MSRASLFFVWALLSCAPRPSQEPFAERHRSWDASLSQEWSDAAELAGRNVRAVAPETVPDLPRRFVHRLDRLGCRIGQAFEHGPEAVSGEFAVNGQTDWAVVCVRGEQSTIIVHWGGSTRCTEQPLAWVPNRHFMETVGGAPGRLTMVFTRHIGVVQPNEESSRYLARDLRLERVDHDGIEDWHDNIRNFTYVFCHGGKWIAKYVTGE